MIYLSVYKIYEKRSTRSDKKQICLKFIPGHYFILFFSKCEHIYLYILILDSSYVSKLHKEKF